MAGPTGGVLARDRARSPRMDGHGGEITGGKKHDLVYRRRLLEHQWSTTNALGTVR
jgi:hypothetical protein